MAAASINWGVATPAQIRLRSRIEQFKNLRDDLKEERDAMVQMIDGSDYSELESKYGIEAGDGDDMFAELDSAIGKMFVNTEVTNVLAALDQLHAKFL